MLYADRVIEYSEFTQINILKKEGKMDGQLKVADCSSYSRTK